MANNRGGLSKREFAAAQAGKPMPYSKTAKTSTPSGGSTNFSKQLKSAQSAYQKTLKPTAEEDTATNTLNNLVASKELGLNKIKDEPIAMPFAVGQSASLERQTEAKAVPLKLQIATLQARRQAAANVSKSQIDYVIGNIDRANAASKASAAEETTTLNNEKTKAQTAKLNKPAAKKETASDWKQVSVEKGPTGRVRAIVERNQKTGETRRTPVK
jgi:hypothetical protein